MVDLGGAIDLSDKIRGSHQSSNRDWFATGDHNRDVSESNHGTTSGYKVFAGASMSMRGTLLSAYNAEDMFNNDMKSAHIQTTAHVQRAKSIMGTGG